MRKKIPFATTFDEKMLKVMKQKALDKDMKINEFIEYLLDFYILNEMKESRDKSNG